MKYTKPHKALIANDIERQAQYVSKEIAEVREREEAWTRVLEETKRQHQEAIGQLQRQVLALRDSFIAHPLVTEGWAPATTPMEWEPTVALPDISGFYIQQMQIEGWAPQEYRQPSITPALPGIEQPTPQAYSGRSTIQAWERQTGSRV